MKNSVIRIFGCIFLLINTAFSQAQQGTSVKVKRDFFPKSIEVNLTKGQQISHIYKDTAVNKRTEG